jgi:hypothetical protein
LMFKINDHEIYPDLVFRDRTLMIVLSLRLMIMCFFPNL